MQGKEVQMIIRVQTLSSCCKLWSDCPCFNSDDRSAEVFQKRIDTATQMKSVLGTNEKPNCLIIDEIDGAPSVHLEDPIFHCPSTLTKVVYKVNIHFKNNVFLVYRLLSTSC